MIALQLIVKSNFICETWPSVLCFCLLRHRRRRRRLSGHRFYAPLQKLNVNIELRSQNFDYPFFV